MVLTTRQVGEALGLSMAVARKLMSRLPAARREAVRPGAIEGWVVDDDALNALAPGKLQELIEEARTEAQGSTFGGAASTRSTASAGPTRSPLAADLADAEAEIRREELELRRLRIRVERERLEGETQRRSPASGDNLASVLLLQELGEVKRQLAEVGKRGESATLAQILAPFVPKLVEVLGGRPALGIPELLNLVKGERADPLQLLERLKALGVLDSGGSLDQVEKLGRVIDVVRKVAGQFGEGGAESAWVEVVRVLGPEIGRVGDKIASAWQDSLTLRRRELEMRRAGTASSPAAAVARLNEDLAREAARENDAFFPKLVQRLSPLFEGRGREFLAAIQRGEVSEPEAFETLQGVGFALTPQVRTYLRRFINWLRAGARAQPTAPPAPRPEDNERQPPAGRPAPGAVIGKCVNAACREEYLFETEAIWEAEKDDPCSKCGSRLERVGVGTA